MADLAMSVVELLAPQPGERILDLGCGDGALTGQLVARGGQVVGIDSSAAQVAATRERGLDAHVMDGEHLPFANEFDAVFSNAALHWMPRADDVLAGVWRALKPGGRFVAECGGDGCLAQVVAALLTALKRRGITDEGVNPWYFPTIEEYRGRLEAQGFRVAFIALIPCPTPLPSDITDWLETFAESFTSVVPMGERAAFITEVRAALRPALCDAGGQWTVDRMRLRFAAEKPRTSDVETTLPP